MLKIAVSSRSLFHMEDGNRIFEKKGQEAFNQYMRQKENVPLRPGVAFPLVKKLLALNGLLPPDTQVGVEVMLLSRNSPDAGLRVMNSAEHYGLSITAAAFSQGTDRFRYAQALGANLFLSANYADVDAALKNNLAAAVMLPAESSEESNDDVVRIAFDGDAVLFSSEADEIYRTHGLEAFQRNELENAKIPLGAGPFKKVLAAIHELQKRLPSESASRLKVALVTARGLPSHARVLHTLRDWKITVDEAIFCGGRPKGMLLKAFGADVFFDDTQKNIDDAVRCQVPSGRVPYGSGQGIVGVS